jgi:hypothetical protein
VPFDTTDVVLLALVVVFAGWALRSMVRARRTDAGRREFLVAFAAGQGLREREAVGPRSEADVTVESMMRRWSRNPALADPPGGSLVLEGTLDGLPFVVDEVWVRKWWSSLRDAHLRMAVELPGLPSGLKVEVLSKHLHEQPLPPSARLGKVLPNDLEGLIMRCLAKEPGERPRSARDLWRALRSCGDAAAWNVLEAEQWWKEKQEAIAGRREESRRRGPQDGETATKPIAVPRRTIQR